MARQYFDNMERDAQQNRRRPSKYDQCYAQLPQSFNTDDVIRIYGIERLAASQAISRLKKQGFIESIKKGQFKKLKTSLI